MTAHDPLPPGHGVKWRRRIGYLPLVSLAIASLVSLVIGIRTETVSEEHLVPVPVESTGDPISALCRPPVEPASQEPWLAGDGTAEAVWQQNAAQVAEPYFTGPNGWTFWSDYIESYASQAVGRATLSSSQVDNWISYYGSIRDGLAAEGIELQIIVTPSTSSVYPEELPEWMQSVRGSTIMDQFMAEAADLPVIDLRQNLIEAKTDDVHLFSWSNSHWTDFGGYVGWKQIAACMNATSGRDDLRVPAISGHEITGDFNEWATYGVPSPGADWSVPVFSDPLEDVTYTDKDSVTTTVSGDTPIDAGWLPVSTSVDNSWTGKSALILRDSMGGALSPYWDQAYSTTRQIYHQWAGFQTFPDYRALVAEQKPDVVIVQLAERHLVNAPPPGASY